MFIKRALFQSVLTLVSRNNVEILETWTNDSQLIHNYIWGTFEQWSISYQLAHARHEFPGILICCNKSKFRFLCISYTHAYCFSNYLHTMIPQTNGNSEYSIWNYIPKYHAWEDIVHSSLIITWSVFSIIFTINTNSSSVIWVVDQSPPRYIKYKNTTKCISTNRQRDFIGLRGSIH